MAGQREKLPDKISIDMTPMIDCVFQLITFFMLTLKTVISEGDFQIRMPLGVSAGAASEDALPPVQVKMRANGDGTLAGIAMNGQAVPDFEQLRRKVIDLVGTGPGSNADKTEVELDCDYNLKYVNVVNAVSAVSGVPQADGTTIDLIKKIKFTPPKRR